MSSHGPWTALQKKWAISKQYALFATPVGYLLNEEGVTMAEAAVGGEAILALLKEKAAVLT